MKKLTLSSKKCSKIHIGKNNACCPDLKVHGEKMKTSLKEKYLGDQITHHGNNKATIEDRVSKGVGIVTEIIAILDDVPLGQYRVEMGLKLRQAMLLNGLLFNSEGWHAVTKVDIRKLEKVDEILLRSLLQCHPKTPLEFLYLETGSMPIRHILSLRRTNYLKTLLMRDEEELTKRILREQQQNTSPGDFWELVSDDLKLLGHNYNEEFISNSGSNKYKTHMKHLTRVAAFNELIDIKNEHTKVKNIDYKKFETQPYLSSAMFTNEDVSILASLRSHTTRGIRNNFRKLYKNNTDCPLNCQLPGAPPFQDTQQHLLVCSKLALPSTIIARTQIKYDDIYGDTGKQIEVVSVYKQLLHTRNSLLEAIS